MKEYLIKIKFPNYKSFPAHDVFNGDAERFKLEQKLLDLALAYEYDPYFSLSVAKVDPVPHQLEAVYNYITIIKDMISFD